MGAGMDPEMVRKIDEVLTRVKEPETLLPVADLNLVSRVTYSKIYDKLVVETDITSPRFPCAVCGIITRTIRDSIQRDLETEFRREFPGMNVVVTQSDIEDW
jgi:metal-sulfur cluster biosynthetic enzyme